jgi:TatD DNase family protein
MIIDSHCHLEYEPIASNLDSVIKRALDLNIKYLLSICTTNDSYEKILDITSNYKNIFGTYGIHPHEAKKYKNLVSKKIIEQVLRSKKIIGIGETGLDFFYKNSEPEVQKKVFIEHIYAAQSLNIPLIIHTRAAENKTYEILNSEIKNKDLKVLIHCFTGSKNFAHKLIDLGCYISASGIVTFKNSKELSDTFLSLPNDKILVETDSPFLAPVPLRGKTNEPSNIIHTVEHLADLKKINKEEFASITTNNFFKLFGKLN